MPPEANDPPLANSFEELIEIICTKPVHFLNDLLYCYTPVSDGKTDTQWIPKRYIANHVFAAVRRRDNPALQRTGRAERSL